MSCAKSLQNIKLDATASGETWPGLTFTIDASDDTEYAAALSRVRMTWQDTAGVAALTLDSDASGQIEISSATAYAWEFTIEPRILGLTPGFYSWAIETTAADGKINKDLLAGSHQITDDPHA
jgi:hypothetical protein